MNILFIVAHPDDEAIGAGATIARLKREGHMVAVLTISHSSVTRHDDLVDKQRKSHDILGVDKSYFGDIETMKFSEADRYRITCGIENVIMAVEPDIIFTHYDKDIHNDHRVVSGIVKEATKLPLRQTGYSKKIKAIYCMEILSSTEWGEGFEPNFFIEVQEDDIEKKIESIEVYDEVLREVPHPRNRETIYALARIRGSQSGGRWAEAFRQIYGAM